MQNGLRHAAQDRALDRVEPSGAAHDQRRINLIDDVRADQPDIEDRREKRRRSVRAAAGGETTSQQT
jgi:hypothetical protein